MSYLDVFFMQENKTSLNLSYHWALSLQFAAAAFIFLSVCEKNLNVIKQLSRAFSSSLQSHSIKAVNRLEYSYP